MTFSMHQRRIRNELKLEMLLAALLQKLGLALAVWTCWPDTVFTL